MTVFIVILQAAIVPMLHSEENYIFFLLSQWRKNNVDKINSKL